MVVCESCRSVEARYRCPACGVRTCSVECVTRHKQNDRCSGTRDRAQFVSKKEYAEPNWQLDLNFLADVHRVARNSGVRNGTDDANSSAQRHTHPQRRLTGKEFALQRLAAQRGTRLEFLPNTFSRHTANRTRVVKMKPRQNKPEQQQNAPDVEPAPVPDSARANGLVMSWTLEACFREGTSMEQEASLVTVHSIFETETIRTVLDHLLARRQTESEHGSGDGAGASENASATQEHRQAQKRIKMDQIEATEKSCNYKVYLRMERCRAAGSNAQAFKLLSLSQTLADALSNSLVIEYPHLECLVEGIERPEWDTPICGTCVRDVASLNPSGSLFHGKPCLVHEVNTLAEP
ncbi:Box C/D snoRNA protein 1 [Porphyridium purpureum]|uniref:Box C/D snoRNA protein 1 n=1 Tax=Porphyridium purpureum TaxID=35688 RepID=A0A5J4YS75_PORPP|nr:Box C/D snoRNA protein 1 [Porphyridium purpureum]|eukprot:POR0590..scf296_7